MFRFIFALLLLVGVCIATPAEAKSCKKPSVSLNGTPQSLAYQNCMADRKEWTRIQDDRQLKRFVKAGILVPLPQNKHVKIDKRLKKKFR